MERVKEIIERLERVFPDKIELEFSNPFELLIAIVLSAQTTDKKTNQVTRRLFQIYKTPYDLANAPLEDIQKHIYGVNYHRRKAGFIKELSNIIVQKYKGDIPKSIEELVELPGVGRKTASMFLYNAFGINEGIAVDTHVERVSKRLGLTQSKNRDNIEKDLMKITPQNLWGKLSNLFILHGRYVCLAKAPKCGQCVLSDLCPSAFKNAP